MIASHLFWPQKKSLPAICFDLKELKKKIQGSLDIP